MNPILSSVGGVKIYQWKRTEVEMAWESSIGCSDVYIYYLGHGRDYRRIQRWKGWEGSGSWREVSGVNGGKWGVLDIWGVLINIRIIELK